MKSLFNEQQVAMPPYVYTALQNIEDRMNTVQFKRKAKHYQQGFSLSLNCFEMPPPVPRDSGLLIDAEV